MPRCLLSQEFVKSLQGIKTKKIIHFSDIDIPGFILEFRPSGGGTWYARYRSEGRVRYLHLGTINDTKCTDARRDAIHFLNRTENNFINLKKKWCAYQLRSIFPLIPQHQMTNPCIPV